MARTLYRRALRLALYGLPAHYDEAAGNLLGMATLADGQRAIRYGLRALKYANRVNDIRHIVSGGRIVAAAFKRAGQFDQAFNHLELALRIADSRGITLERSRALAERASVLYWSGNVQEELAEAEEAYGLALESAESVNDHYGVLRARVGLGFCALRRGATADAEAWFGKLRSGLDRETHPELHAFLEQGRACISHQLGDLRLAARQYAEVMQLCSRWPKWLLSLRAAATVGAGAVLWHLRPDQPKLAQRMWSQARRLSRGAAGIAQVTAVSIERCKADRRNVPL